MRPVVLFGVLPDPDFLCDLRLLDARHEAVSAFFERGLDMMEVATISGHKTLSCLKRYTHMRPEYRSKITETDNSLSG